MFTFLNLPLILNLVLIWLFIFAFFGLMSGVLYFQSKKKTKSLKEKEGVLFFAPVEIHRTAKSKIGINTSFPSKIRLGIFENRLYFLADRYRLSLFSNPVPGDLNLHANDLEIIPEFSKTIILKFPSEALTTPFIRLLLIKTHFEISLTCHTPEQRDRILSILRKRLE